MSGCGFAANEAEFPKAHNANPPPSTTGRFRSNTVCSRAIFQHSAISRSQSLELPTKHRLPVNWIRENACAPIRWRTVTEILPFGSATPADLQSLHDELLQYKGVTQTIKKQKDTGVWGANILGIAPSKAQSIKAVGTVTQYRRLLELGVPTEERPYRLAERVLYRLLSRDRDAALLFEHRKAAKTNPALGTWARELMREAGTAALAHSGQIEDPRVRGSAHRIATSVSQFLRGELSRRPIVRKGSRNILHPDAHPPSVFSVAMVAYMPNLQRERAGFVERLGSYLARPATRRSYVITVGRKVIKPTFQILGDPLQADSAGNAKDLPFALHWIELLSRLGMLESSPTAIRILNRLVRDCDEQGVWSPRNLRALPKSPSKLADFAFPLEQDGRTPERRRADVTFRLGLIAKLAGWELEYV